MSDTLQPSGWSEALGKIPSGLFVLTVRNMDRETGMLASWVCQAGFEPPMFSVAVRRERYVADWLTEGAACVLNVLAQENKRCLAHFGRGFGIDEPAFAGLEISRDLRKVPIIPEIVAYLSGVPRSHLDSGDHRIFLVEITGGDILQEIPPAVHVRRNGLRY